MKSNKFGSPTSAVRTLGITTSVAVALLVASSAWATVTTFSGADPGEGLDLSGTFVQAVDLSGSGGVVHDATFTAFTSSPTGDVSLNGSPYTNIGVLIPPNYGAGSADQTLAAIMTKIYFGNPMTLTVGNLTPGTEYKLQLLFQEVLYPAGGAHRVFDVTVKTGLTTVDFEPVDLSTSWAGSSSGVVLADTFTAMDPTLTVVLGRQNADNTILNAFTLEQIIPEPSTAALFGVGAVVFWLRQRGKSKKFGATMNVALVAALLAASPAWATVTTFSGADPGEGLDLSGTFVQAVDVGGAGTVVNGLTFTAFPSTPQGNVSITGGGHWGPGPSAPTYGGSIGDLALGLVMNQIWLNEFTLQVSGLTGGTTYKLQLLYQEPLYTQDQVTHGTYRSFDVSINGGTPELVDLSSTYSGGPQGVVLTDTFTALSSTLTVSETLVKDNPILNAFTLEQIIPEPSVVTLFGFGASVLWFRRWRSRRAA